MGKVCLRGLGAGGSYGFFLAESIFKIGSLNRFSTETTFRYSKTGKFRGMHFSCVKIVLGKCVYLYCIYLACIFYYSLQFIFYMWIPHSKECYKKRELIIIQKWTLFNDSWLDSSSWITCNISMQRVIIGRKKGKKRKQKYSVHNFSEHLQHYEAFWKVNECNS